MCLDQISVVRVCHKPKLKKPGGTRVDEGVWGVVPSKLQCNSKLCLPRARSLLPPAPTPSLWYLPIPSPPTCEALSKVMKATEECQMITKSHWTAPSHSQPCLPFYCPLYLPSPPPPLSSQGWEMQLLSAAEGLQADLSLSGIHSTIMSTAPSSMYHVLPPSCFQEPHFPPFVWNGWTAQTVWWMV